MKAAACPSTGILAVQVQAFGFSGSGGGGGAAAAVAAFATRRSSWELAFAVLLKIETCINFRGRVWGFEFGV